MGLDGIYAIDAVPDLTLQILIDRIPRSRTHNSSIARPSSASCGGCVMDASVLTADNELAVGAVCNKLCSA